ncbi:hypothetical protein A3A46_03835 [Candidatus Roizmanbacteria bacterium RIFCSPLOWO2_01_FULL_37_13]|uniref:Polymerase nucleotidyl transferase domain-containing protein n=1 Tax=Candidatus Roizmanbacteria bacterium RIFCSPHIGHO2_02_FULL_38_11 TaxID=1802039 RepID=A0A1F7H237_9BACT|nr:MAG: hypothetical protein A3C25_03610 [Candidatus Roizmanbacteria bacterium RIFCSPHIGHO2_02_FULL_38_11]OGK34812.1 MAG: hypothetical protein A3F58_00675 [Candidatus Roizmanbacteria bacterium RIFCSPHIGHO2_12_FULL_37_9b]OGK40910.1 MAG: hypothetical protein A3A46_03835 [Candidatus Roizmanbacteria bacterium RIFCSPLOWO2_01_FULL_37_13]
MKNLYKVLADQNEQRKKYLENPLFYGGKIKKIATELFPDAKILIFGSVASEKFRSDSDFDVLIITNHRFNDLFDQAKMKLKILQHFPVNPFEIHLTTPREFKNWYKGFIKKNYLEV